MTEIRSLETTNNERDLIIKNKIVKECYTIYKVINLYVAQHQPIFNESFNEGYPIEKTYLIKIKYTVIFRIARVLLLLQYRNLTYFSNHEKIITGLSYKSFAFFKEIVLENGNTQYVFCLDTDTKCNGILLSLEY